MEQEATVMIGFKHGFSSCATAKNIYETYKDLDELCGGFSSSKVRVVGFPNFPGEPRLFHHVDSLKKHYEKNEGDYFLCTQGDIENIIATNDRERFLEERRGIDYAPTMMAQLIDRDDKGGSYIYFHDDKGLIGSLKYSETKQPGTYGIRDALKISLGTGMLVTSAASMVLNSSGDLTVAMMNGIVGGLGISLILNGYKGSSRTDYSITGFVQAAINSPRALERLDTARKKIEVKSPD